MNARMAELLESVKRYGVQAVSEWAESYRDSPPSHFITFLFGVAFALAVKLIV